MVLSGFPNRGVSFAARVDSSLVAAHPEKIVTAASAKNTLFIWCLVLLDLQPLLLQNYPAKQRQIVLRNCPVLLKRLGAESAFLPPS